MSCAVFSIFWFVSAARMEVMLRLGTASRGFMKDLERFQSVRGMSLVRNIRIGWRGIILSIDVFVRHRGLLAFRDDDCFELVRRGGDFYDAGKMPQAFCRA